MFCIKCGALINDNDKFCTNCGTPVSLTQMKPPVHAAQSGAAQMKAPSSQYPGQNGSAAQYSGQVNPTGQYQAADMRFAQPAKKKVWPIILIIAAVVLALSVGVVFLVKAISDTFTGSGKDEDITVGLGADEQEEIGEEIEQQINDYIEQYTDIEGLGEDAAEDNAEDIAEDIVEELPADLDIIEYEYSNVADTGDKFVVMKNNVINDDTVMYNGKTMGGLCDYLDSNVVAEGRAIDRDKFYELAELHCIDPSFCEDEEAFLQAMVLAVNLAYEFDDMPVEYTTLTYDKADFSVYYYNVKLPGGEETWSIDYTNSQIYQNNGNTQYNSHGEYGFFTDKKYALWELAISEYFGISI